MHPLIPAGLALALGAPVMALAQPNPEVESLRKEIEAMRSAYEQRLQALEQRLQASEAAAKAAQSSTTGTVAASPASAPAPAATAAAPGTPTVAAAPAATGGGANAFNPAISLILSGTVHAHLARPGAATRSPASPLPPGAEIGPGDARLQPGRNRAGLRGQHRPLAARRRQHRAARRQHGVGGGSLRADDLAGQRPVAQGRALLLRHRLPQRAARPHLGLRRQPAGLPGVPRHASTATTACSCAGWRRPTVPRARRRDRPRPRLSRQRHGAQRRRHRPRCTAHTGGDIGDSHSWRAGLSMLQRQGRPTRT